MKKSTKNFKTPLHFACSKENYKLNSVHFLDGYAFATDSYLLVRQSLKLHGFTEDEIEGMDGKSLNYNDFKVIYNADFVVVENGVIKFDGEELPLQDSNFPNIKSVIPSYDDDVELGNFKVDLKYLELVRKLSFENKTFDIMFPNEINMLIKNESLTYDDELFLLILKS